MDYSYNYADNEYASAVNCEHTQYFNPPITVTINAVKYILPFGTTDNKSAKIEGNTLVIIGVNYDLDYASIAVIDTENKTCIDGYFDDLEQSFYDLELNQQIKILSDYLPY